MSTAAAPASRHLFSSCPLAPVYERREAVEVVATRRTMLGTHGARGALAAMRAGVEATPTPVAAPDTRLSGRRLLLARLGCGAFAAVIVGLYAASLPGYMRFLRAPCVGDACFIDGALTPAALLALRHSGLSLEGYGALLIVP
jgi:hypothetical protein